jgi:hypothetical protein
MSFALNDTLRQARGQVIINAIDAGSGPGKLILYTAPQPSIKGAAITTQTQLGVMLFADPCGSNTAGVSTLTLNSDPTADADGDVAWGRVTDSAGVFVADISATLLAGAGPIRMPSLTVYAGGPVNVASVVLTEGDA